VLHGPLAPGAHQPDNVHSPLCMQAGLQQEPQGLVAVSAAIRRAGPGAELLLHGDHLWHDPASSLSAPVPTPRLVPGPYGPTFRPLSCVSNLLQL
jgi:hypothetical protein